MNDIFDTITKKGGKGLRMRKRASITVFSALAFALVASLPYMALLEAGRVYQIQTYADMKSTLALESVCAEYQPMLWEEFHLLGLDGAYGGDIFSMDHVTACFKESSLTGIWTLMEREGSILARSPLQEQSRWHTV